MQQHGKGLRIDAGPSEYARYTSGGLTAMDTVVDEGRAVYAEVLAYPGWKMFM